MNYE